MSERRRLLFSCAGAGIVALALLAVQRSSGGASVDGAADDADERPTLTVKACEDFEVDGSGNHAAWMAAEWTALNRRERAAHDYTARFKVLYSSTGLYFLMEGTDQRLSASFEDDFENLWTEDVFEVFLWTDERYPVYFEYEISPLNRELPIIIPNFEGKFLGWRPWHYEGERKIRKATTTRGGKRESGASIDGWRAEFFVPYQLLQPLQNVPPKSGTRWRANFYRVDHDGGEKTAWDWARVGPSFHEYRKFGSLRFE